MTPMQIIKNMYECCKEENILILNNDGIKEVISAVDFLNNKEKNDLLLNFIDNM